MHGNFQIMENFKQVSFQKEVYVQPFRNVIIERAHNGVLSINALNTAR